MVRSLPEDGHTIYLFLGSEAGDDRAAIIYTVLETAKLNGFDLEAYLDNVVIGKIPLLQVIKSSRKFSFWVG